MISPHKFLLPNIIFSLLPHHYCLLRHLIWIYGSITAYSRGVPKECYGKAFLFFYFVIVLSIKLSSINSKFYRILEKHVFQQLFMLASHVTNKKTGFFLAREVYDSRCLWSSITTFVLETWVSFQEYVGLVRYLASLRS